MTLGEIRVAIDFTPSGTHLIDELKHQAADFIDAIDTIPHHAVDADLEICGVWEVIRFKALGMTEVKSAAMWASSPPRASTSSAEAARAHGSAVLKQAPPTPPAPSVARDQAREGNRAPGRGCAPAGRRRRRENGHRRDRADAHRRRSVYAHSFGLEPI